ncbi:hypothetical protein ACI6QG_13695 [Roseococcus sp. DSY-14]|uniref:hypothetical protein n=1 Tax=Roseococcus sp. DSY-14 TaxID=3369650 RepID=UPI00387B490F
MSNALPFRSARIAQALRLGARPAAPAAAPAVAGATLILARLLLARMRPARPVPPLTAPG